MENKKCNKCNEILPVIKFGIEKRAKNGFKPRCKKCTNIYQSKYFTENKDKYQFYGKKYYQKNKDIIIEKVKKYSLNNINKKEYNKKYNIDNKDSINISAKKRAKIRLQNDNNYRFIKNVRKLIYRLKIEKNKSTELLLNYSYLDLINYLGRTPEKDEHLDHKIPVSWFVENTPIFLIHSLNNLQILKKEQNLQKGNKFSHEIPYEYFLQIQSFINKDKISKINLIQ